MALIDCPQCGHKVLSVASTCPKCGFSLSEQRKKEAHFSKNVRCKNCRREIAPASRICPHCGEVRPVRRYKPWPAVAVLGVGIIATASLILRSAGSESRQSEQPTTVVQPQPTPPDTTPIDSAEPDSVPMAEPIIAAPAVAPTEIATPSTLTRWTSDWANVRAGRGMQDSILRVLRPGQPVAVADLESGWWAVYIEGRRVGFVSQSLLVDQLPPQEPDTGRAEFRQP